MVQENFSDDFTVFISYAHSDNENSDHEQRWLDRLLEYLQPFVIQQRIRVWADPEIEVGDQWERSVEAQVLNADAAVLLISPAFLGSKYIRNSELPVLLMNAKNQGTTVLPIILRHSPFAETTFKYPDPVLGPNELSLSIFQSANPPDEPLNAIEKHKQDKILLSVAQRISELAKTKTATRSPATRSTIWTVPHGHNPFFTGRTQVFDNLHRELAARSKVAISGMGGIGKTQTAAQYARHHREEYKAVLSANAGSKDSLESDFGALAATLNLPVRNDSDKKNATIAVKRWLDEHSGWLLILDNADDFELVSDLLRREWAGHILLTTRAHATGSISKVDLNVMGSEEGALLLLRRAKLIAPDETLGAASEADRESATEITRELGGLPLALDQAGAFIEEMSSSLAEYLEHYRLEGNQLTVEHGGYIPDHDPVTITFSMAFRNVAESSAAAADLVKVCAFLAPDAIPEEFFATGASEMGENLASMAGRGSNLIKVIGAAGRFSLIRRDATRRSIEIHRLVQQVLKDEMNTAERRLWAERIVRGMNATFPVVEYKNWPLCERLLPHALEIARLIENYDLAFIESAQLLNDVGHYCFERAQYPEAERLFKQAQTIRERVLGPEDPNVAMSLSNLAALYHRLGRYEEAEPLFIRALAIREQTSEADDLGVSLILNNLAAFYESLGRYTEAKPLYERSLGIRERVYGPDNTGVATSLNNLAALYVHLDLQAQAETLFKRSLAIRERELGPDDPDVAGSLNSLAGIYNDQGRYAEAKPLLDRSLAIRERSLGPNHPDVAKVLNNLATFYERQGQYAEAKALYERTLAIFEKTLVPDHLTIASTRKQYTELLRRIGTTAWQ
jgi:tetratricopeptide (TPR) repeat protein